MMNQSAQYQRLFAGVKEIINSVLLSNVAGISFSRLSISLYEDREKKRKETISSSALFSYLNNRSPSSCLYRASISSSSLSSSFNSSF